MEQPWENTEDPTSTFRDRITIQSYPVQELGGLLMWVPGGFVYLLVIVAIVG